MVFATQHYRIRRCSGVYPVSCIRTQAICFPRDFEFQNQGKFPMSAVKFFSTRIPQWPLETKTKYTFIPLPSDHRDPFLRRELKLSPQTGKLTEEWDTHEYPYQKLPDLECHIAPPFAVINGAAKFTARDLDTIILAYCQSSDATGFKHRLELLLEIWKILQNSKENAEDWRRGIQGIRKREQDDEDVERLTQSSLRTTRSRSRKLPRLSNDDSVALTGRKRKAPPSSCGTQLTKHAVSHLNKRQKTSNFRAAMKHWAESIQGDG
jgi:hypothetical protein